MGVAQNALRIHQKALRTADVDPSIRVVRTRDPKPGLRKKFVDGLQRDLAPESDWSRFCLKLNDALYKSPPKCNWSQKHQDKFINEVRLSHNDMAERTQARK